MTAFQLADNHMDGNSGPPSISGKSVTIDQSVLQMEHIYQLMLAKVLTNIKKSHISQQKHYSMQTLKNPFKVGEKVLKMNMANDPCKAKMKPSGQGHTQL